VAGLLKVPLSKRLDWKIEGGDKRKETLKKKWVDEPFFSLLKINLLDKLFS
jgi:hypothetical protein